MCGFIIPNKLDKLSAFSKAITKNNRAISILDLTILDNSNSDPRLTLIPKLIPICELAPIITYIEADLQQLLRISISAKEIPQNP